MRFVFFLTCKKCAFIKLSRLVQMTLRTTNSMSWLCWHSAKFSNFVILGTKRVKFPKKHPFKNWTTFKVLWTQAWLPLISISSSFTPLKAQDIKNFFITKNISMYECLLFNMKIPLVWLPLLSFFIIQRNTSKNVQRWNFCQSSW